MDEILDVERENAQAITDRERYEESQSQDDLFPVDLDLEKNVSEGYIHLGINALAKSIFNGLKDQDPIRVEQLADELQDLANQAHKEHHKKHQENKDEQKLPF